MVNKILAGFLVIGAGSLTAQRTTNVSVPFVGCESDGQTELGNAPTGEAIDMAIGAEPARRLAYYTAAEGPGVLAPRGWYCFGTYGSGGEYLFVSPQPIDRGNLFSDNWSGSLAPAVQLGHGYGDTSGRFNVAKVIARVFPAYREFAIRVMQELPPPEKFLFGPYPRDVLTYKSKTVVEYRTPAHTDGLGTVSLLKKNGSPITGVAILVEDSPDLIQLAVRLPPDLTVLAAVITQQVEREAEGRPHPKSDR